MNTGVRIVVNPSDLDVDRLHRWLAEDAYWARGRSRDQVARAAAGSVNLVALADAEMVGYARLVTDRALFAWLADVYVDPSSRGAGVGKALMARVVALLEEWGVARTVLRTEDAHGLYESFDFTTVTDPTIWMIRRSG